MKEVLFVLVVCVSIGTIGYIGFWAEKHSSIRTMQQDVNELKRILTKNAVDRITTYEAKTDKEIVNEINRLNAEVNARETLIMELKVRLRHRSSEQKEF